MLKLAYLPFFVLVAILAISSCTKDKAVTPSCETITKRVRYTTKIDPIFQASCQGSACHSSGNTVSREFFDSASVADYVSDSASAVKLICRLKGNTCGAKMPSGGGSISTCDLALIQSWADSGFFQ
jgi:hypothetical protein